MKKIILYIAFFASVVSYAQAPVVETYIASSNTGTSIDMTKPAFVAAGDLLLIMVATDDNQAADEWQTLSGWTKLNEAGNSTSDCHVAVYYRIATGSEGVTTTVSATANNDLSGVYARISGFDDTDIIDVTGADTITNGTSHTTSSITAAANTLIITVLGFDGADGSPFSDGTGSIFTVKSQSTQGSSVNGVAFVWSTKTQVTAGSSGASITDSSTSDGAASFMFSINAKPIERRIFNIN